MTKYYINVCNSTLLLTRTQSTASIAKSTYHSLGSFSRRNKDSCQFRAKECAQVLINRLED